MGKFGLHPLIVAERALALKRIRAHRIPLVELDGVLVYECPDCRSTSSDPGFAAWHQRGDCVIPDKNSPNGRGSDSPSRRTPVEAPAKYSGERGGSR